MSEKDSRTSPHLMHVSPLEAERMHHIQLLLEHLFKHEDTTVRLILDHLYDVGSKNLIQQKIRCRSIRRIAKPVAKLSKPVFRVFALRWFHNNCPELITTWLHSQVAFEAKTTAQNVTTISPTPYPSETSLLQESPELTTKINYYQREICQLRTKLRWLTGTLVSAIALLGGSLVWVSYNSGAITSQTALPPQSIPVEVLETPRP
ncbi:hypothetical protein [Myxacorys almedinensis]|uniref:Uncharacterized protein n=1 Tax=Myxacorys almedinensis A TaxID=2690445 RepID=A0A8J7Z4V4_9CYAN|nr:hypothetical protein [Myxacorys almedinensis]NDJ18143.1 hypothetical protein [Myxacorys almedinensis A]